VNMNPEQIEQQMRREMPGWTRKDSIMTREEAELAFLNAGWSNTKAAELAEIYVAIEAHKAAGVPFVRIERECKS
jgi:hypothetical protein